MNNCRSFPPFYEKEVDGKCVSSPPTVAPDTKMDYIFTAVLIVGLFGIVYYAMQKI